MQFFVPFCHTLSKFIWPYCCPPPRAEGWDVKLKINTFTVKDEFISCRCYLQGEGIYPLEIHCQQVKSEEEKNHSIEILFCFLLKKQKQYKNYLKHLNNVQISYELLCYINISFALIISNRKNVSHSVWRSTYAKATFNTSTIHICRRFLALAVLYNQVTSRSML